MPFISKKIFNDLSKKYPNKLFILIILLVFTSIGVCKKQVIIKCLLSDGTISYQEKSCNTFPKTSNRPKAKVQSIKRNKAPIQYSLNDKQLDNISVLNSSVKKVSNRVKGYNISLDALDNWSIVNKVYNDKLLHMKFLDNHLGNEISLLIDFIYPDNKVFSIAELTEIIHLVGSRFVAGSKEGQINIYSINNFDGKGVVATFTHSAIMPHYKYSSKGAIFKDNWLVQFTLLSNNLTSNSHEFALQTLFNTLDIKKI
jgi:hypothetical protein